MQGTVSARPPLQAWRGTRRGYKEGIGGGTVEMLSYLISLKFWGKLLLGKSIDRYIEKYENYKEYEKENIYTERKCNTGYHLAKN